ncbi:hypothetical protein M427DRAFT_66795 [Gonapodya prolifera JEL478]|uniref:Uncharacterized protein n=1 Tax=Gonapodya prolifera (strain JEL478) TaxID=1344416 RepID=A0A139AUW5_GONPJ|nr:hypothetical protein M427DRAFT_66795 [Gonapodya prolifera JEL478]|eukprot:KXS20285.1 hypothetical protein M427DRAFT_66795 [Gonapodya prolifera JEL478]
MGLFGKRKPDPADAPAERPPQPDPNPPPPAFVEPVGKTKEAKTGKSLTRQNSTFPEKPPSKEEGKKAGRMEGAGPPEDRPPPVKKQGSKFGIDPKKADGKSKEEDVSKKDGKHPDGGMKKKEDGKKKDDHKLDAQPKDDAETKGKSQKKKVPLSKGQSLAVVEHPHDVVGKETAANDTKNVTLGKGKPAESAKKASKSSTEESKSRLRKEATKDTTPSKDEHEFSDNGRHPRRADDRGYLSSDAESDYYEVESRRRRQRLATEREADRAQKRRRPSSAIKAIKSPSRVLLARASMGGPDNAQAANSLRVYYRGKLDMERRKYLSLEAEKKFLVGRVKELEIDLAKAKSSTLKEARPQEGKLVLDLRFQIKMQQLEIAKLKESLHSMERRIQDEAKANEKLHHQIDNQKEIGARHESHKKAQLANIVKDRGELETKFRQLQMELAKERKAKEWKGVMNAQLELERQEQFTTSYRRDVASGDETEGATRRKPRAVIAPANDE